ncbi:DUF559 domain-containing protein [Salegentibacter salegens]|uniref:DUF559 domain-containing protein n=1 Tax=Salegentibacter salegens TaxID=143223 RepID=UPI000D42DEC8|nr:DUF559 domain-containing protein [Salegentibacter salegens]PRX44093.1 uncharacterized protein DUF559 [Salegentibacter salegens]
MIIELDGGVHLNSATEERDLKRTGYLEGIEFKVIRFENKMVFDFLPTVLKEIKNNFRTT